MSLINSLGTFLAEAIAQFNVPGASLAVLINGEVAYSIPGNAIPLVVEFMNPDSNGHFTALHAAMRLNLLNR